MLEPYLIAHCAPTLASLKTASLFRLAAVSEPELRQQLADWNALLRQKGLFLLLLRQRGEEALLYLYRASQLRADLQKPGMCRFLARYGYPAADLAAADLTALLKRLQQRLQESEDFPHEIGLFLGYPLGDVAGFIRHGGRNCKCCGCWKVYGNECEARRTFARFHKCSAVYARLWQAGRSVGQLTVKA